jgi:SH3-like domain-containing protein
MKLLTLTLLLQILIQPMLTAQSEGMTSQDIRSRLDSLDNQWVLLEIELTKLQRQIEAVKSESDSLKWLLTRIQFADVIDEGVFVEAIHRAKIRVEPHVFADVIEEIQRDTQLMVLDYYRGYWKVSHGGELGYVHESLTSTNREASLVRRLPRQSQAWVESTVADVKIAPTIDSEVAVRLGKGDFIHVVRDSSNWLEIAYGESYTTGWIHKDSVSWKRVLKP